MSEYRAMEVPVLTSPAVDRAVVQGRARGYADGLAAARVQAAQDKADRQAEHQQLLAGLQDINQARAEALNRAAVELSTRQVQALEDVRDEVFTAACRVAALILGEELTDASTVARATIRRVMSAQTPTPVHTIRLHPEAAAAAPDCGLTVGAVQVVADPAIPAGGAVAEYQDGWLSAGLEEALSRVMDVALASQGSAAQQPSVDAGSR